MKLIQTLQRKTVNLSKSVLIYLVSAVHQCSIKFEFEMHQIQINSIGKLLLQIEKWCTVLSVVNSRAGPLLPRGPACFWYLYVVNSALCCTVLSHLFMFLVSFNVNAWSSAWTFNCDWHRGDDRVAIVNAFATPPAAETVTTSLPRLTGAQLAIMQFAVGARSRRARTVEMHLFKNTNIYNMLEQQLKSRTCTSPRATRDQNERGLPSHPCHSLGKNVRLIVPRPIGLIN
jgi:hypothetical protein